MPLPSQAAIYPVLLNVLHELGGRARPQDVYPRVTQHFPQLQPEELAATLKSGNNRWYNRINWARQGLVQAGLIDRSTKGSWALTAEGQDLVRRGVSSREIVALVAARIRRPQQPNLSRRVSTLAPEPLQPEAVAVSPSPEPRARPSLAPVPSRSERLVTELREAAIDVRDPTRLERAVAEAFRFLGYDAEWIGGPGNTDVLIHAPLGIRRYSVVIDAKATSRGRVAGQQIDWLSIRTHRDKAKAGYACVIGREFASGSLSARAEG